MSIEETFKPVDRKALRLVRSGKVRLVERTGDVIVFEVEGDHQTYRVTWDPEGHHCPCAAHIVRCSHNIACELLIAVAEAEQEKS